MIQEVNDFKREFLNEQYLWAIASSVQVDENGHVDVQLSIADGRDCVDFSAYTYSNKEEMERFIETLTKLGNHCHTLVDRIREKIKGDETS